eukprot:s2532_g13.t1
MCVYIEYHTHAVLEPKLLAIQGSAPLSQKDHAIRGVFAGRLDKAAIFQNMYTSDTDAMLSYCTKSLPGSKEA